MLEAGLSAARARGPDDARLQALEASLSAALGAAAMTAGAGSTAPPSASTAPVTAPGLVSAGALKITVAIVAFAAAAGGLLAHRWRDPRPVVPVGVAPLPHTGASSLTAPPPAPPKVDPSVVAAPAPTAVRAEAKQSIGASRPSRHDARPPAVADQLAVIERAQRALANDPTTALALVERHHRALARSPYAQEAEVVAVAALVRLGRTDEARARAARFAARYPDSVHAPRMRRAAGIIK